MPKIEDLTLSDNTGEKYTFEVYPKESQFNKVAGVYAFTRRTVSQHGPRHKILYIGETRSFRDKPLNYRHHKWWEAIEMGFTHICVLPIDNRRAKLRWLAQSKLIATYMPPLNQRVG